MYLQAGVKLFHFLEVVWFIELSDIPFLYFGLDKKPWLDQRTNHAYFEFNDPVDDTRRKK